MNTAQVPDPVKYPTARIGDKDYPLKFRFCDVVDVPTIQPSKAVAGLERVAQQVDVVVQNLLTCLRFAAENNPEIELTQEWLMKNLDFKDLANITVAINAAMGKATAQAPSVETTPATQLQ